MKLHDFASRLGRAQTAHPWRFIAAAALVTIAAGVVASGLKFDSSYEALLPKGSPEVENADAVRERTGGTRQIVLAIEGKDKDTRVAFGRELADRIRGLEKIRAVDLEFDVDFFKERGLWLMDAATLDELVPAVEEAVKKAKWQANPMNLHLDEEKDKADLEAAWKKVDDIVGKKTKSVPFTNILESKDGRYTFMLVVPSIKFSDIDAGRAMLDRIHKVIAELNPESRGLKVKSAGNLDIMQEQHRTMVKDLRNASILALVLGVLVVASFTRKPSAPFIIGVPLVAGVICTFAIARLFIGHVNIITGFLASVLIGLGIDFGIHIFIRFQQEWHSGDTSKSAAIVASVAGTMPPAITGALTTAGTFASFMFADFRGFSEFGMIAGLGVIFTLAATFIILPPLLTITKARKRRKSAFDPNINAGIQIPRRAALATVAALSAFAVFGGMHVRDIPFRNNFKLLRGESPATQFSDYVDQNLGVGFNPAVILVKSPKDAERVEELARAQKESGLNNGAPSRIGNVLSISDLLPKNPEETRNRIERLREILDDPKLDDAEKQEGKRAEQLAEARRMVKNEPWGIEDLPEMFKRRMTALGGKELIAFVWPDERNDADYQAAKWEDELKELSKKIGAAGVAHSMADETLIIAWIYRIIRADGPPLLIMASIVVLLFLALDFRSLRRTMLVAFPLFVGMMVFIASIYFMRMELNMFNLIVLPSIIGIGIDNAVHIYHRYRLHGPGSLVFVVRSTGIATLLASLTTCIGFGSALISHHLGLKSLGTLAILGLISTFIAAVVFFPCFLSLIEKSNNPAPKS